MKIHQITAPVRITALLLCFLVAPAYAAPSISPTSSIELSVRDIDAHLRHARIRTIELTGTDNGGILKGYYVRHHLRKIEVQVGLSSKMIEDDFYFGKQGLEFVTTTEMLYHWNDKKGEFDYLPYHKDSERSYFFAHGNLISSKSSLNPAKPATRDEAASLMSDAAGYKTWLAEGKKSVQIN